jgi:membrane dipeptidase
MTWRSTASLTPDEARQLHSEALVIDTLAGIGPDIFATPALQAHFDHLLQTADIDCSVIGREMNDRSLAALQHTAEARDAFKDAWRASGVDVASVTLVGGHAPPYGDYDRALSAMGGWHALMRTVDGWLCLALNARDIEKAHADRRPGLMFNFQNTTPYEDKLERIKLFYDLGVRSVQLTYNSTNLVGGGKNDVPLESLAISGGGREDPHVGLTRYGVEVVRMLNELGTIVDVSHSPEKVGFDALEYSKDPISANHTSAAALFPNSQAKSDKLLKAIGDKGGFVGIHIVAGYLQGGPRTTLDHIADHVEHMARVAGIDAVGLGVDQGSYWKLRVPPEIPLMEEKPGFAARGFHWGLSEPGTRRCHKVPVDGYKSFADTPEITVALARHGFNEDEMRKFLGLNYLRLVRDVVG